MSTKWQNEFKQKSGKQNQKYVTDTGHRNITDKALKQWCEPKTLKKNMYNVPYEL